MNTPVHPLTGTEFRSPWWLPDGHTQTLWRRFSSPPTLVRRRQRVELSDGDFIDLDWQDPIAEASAPLIFLLHGLCGSSASPYIVSLQELLQQHGMQSVAMNFRGCSGEINRLARAYHSGCTEDVEEVFHALRRQCGMRPVIFVGFSLGGNVLLRWLSEAGKKDGVLGGIAVSTPFSLSHCSAALNAGLSSLYGHYFRRRLVQDVENKRAYFRQHGQRQQELEKLLGLGDLRRLRSLWEFDDQVTAPLHGFRDAQDYYDRCSSGPRLEDIKRPTYLIQSANDPIIPEACVPQSSQLPATVSLHLTRGGGHVGFTSADDPKWLESLILEALERIIHAGGVAAR